MGSDEPVGGGSEVRKLEERVRELERLLGRKTMENEILREALAKTQAKNRSCGRSRCRRAVSDESRRHCVECRALQPLRAPQGQDAHARSIIRGFVDQRPTYGYRRIAALLNRERAKAGQQPSNRKRVHRIMQRHW